MTWDKLAELNLGPERTRGYSCWGVRLGSTANAVVNAIWFAFVIGLVVYTIVIWATTSWS